MLKITARSIVTELESRGVPVEILEERYGLIRYQHRGRWQLLKSCASANASWLGNLVARHKQIAHSFLKDEGLSEPATELYEDRDSAIRFLDIYKEIVVKPTDGGHGNGVTVGVRDQATLTSAYETALRASKSGKVLLQEQVKGDDIRVLVIGGLFTAAAGRTPASVVGDGVHTVRELIERENSHNKERGHNYSARLNFIDVNAAERFLGPIIDTEVLDEGRTLRVSGPANIGTGGTSSNLTDDIPIEIQKKAERVSQLLGLPTCGVDFVVTDVSDAASYRFIEVNACPSFGLHLFPSSGDSEPVARKFVDHLLESTA